MRNRAASQYSEAVDAIISRSDIELAIRAAHRRGVRPEHVWALVCDRSLLPEGFAGQVASASLASLEATMGQIARIATSDDHLIWVATNHGEADGLLVETEPLDEFAEEDSEPPLISPEWLRQCLDAVPGQHILVVATCYAGIFLPLGNERRAVLACCAANRVYRVDMHAQHPPRSPFLYEFLSHWAGVSLANYEAPTSRSITEAFRAIQPACPGCQSQGTARWPD